MSLEVSLRLLRAFLTVADEGNVGRAAQRIYVSQPSLSQDIRRLERLVGAELFTRTSRGMELTSAGSALCTGVRTGLLAIDRAASEAASLGGSVRRTVSVAYSPSVGNRLMPGLIPILDRLLPDVSIDEREVDTGEVAPGVREGRFDLGFAHCVGSDTQLSARLIAEEPACVAIAETHPIAAAPEVSLEQLSGLDIVIWSRDTAPEYYDHIIGACTRAGLTPAPVPGPRRAVVRPYLLTSGTTFCLLPRSTAMLSVPGVRFVDVRDDDYGTGRVRIPLYAIHRIDDSRRQVLAIEQIAEDQSVSLLA